MEQFALLGTSFKVIPQYCIAHLFCARFSRHQRAHMSVCAYELVRPQNLRDFPQTKLDSEINAPFLLNEHGDPRIFSGIC